MSGKPDPVSTPDIQLYNTLTRRKQPFRPIEEGRVGLYACGVTVYDECHLGHAMQAIVFDMIFRYLEYRGFDVEYVRNYTDVDDKIIERAREVGMEPLELARLMIGREREDMAALGILEPTHTPKVSDYIPQIIGFIEKIVATGKAYATDQGNVYFKVRSMPDYGKLSGRKIDELKSGVRKDVEGDKQDDLDFALWKTEAAEGASWASPWGSGRPGWHIECSVMCHEILGETFDIHGGGLDLIFPHHENEIAQSEAHCGHPHVNYWIHNGLLTVNKDKMSKSQGNFYTISDGVEHFGTELIRFVILQYHYRSSPDFSPRMMAANAGRLLGVYEHLRRLDEMDAALDPAEMNAASDLPAAFQNDVEIGTTKLQAQFVQAMDDDFNSPVAITVLVEMVRFLDTCLRRKKVGNAQRVAAARQVAEQFRTLASIFGLFQEDPAAFFAAIRKRFLRHSGIDDAWIQERIATRDQARAERDFATGDALRDQLLAKGIELRDSPAGTEWMATRDALEAMYGS